MLKNNLEKRKSRNSYRINKNNKSEKPVLMVYKSNKNIYAQIIDISGNVLVSFSSKSKEIADKIIGKTGIDKASEIGKGIAKKALEKNIKEIVFNKGPYLYNGRIKSLANGARDGGLSF